VEGKGAQLETEGQTQQIALVRRLALMGKIGASLAHELNQAKLDGDG
jgi:C4-dicarboxylate-specific signal transduction histidine kinase